jgi:homoserine O-succinyltransferase
MTKLADWAKVHTASTIWSCLAAHAAVLHADGIQRRALKQKLFGVFECRLGADHPMTRDFPDPQWTPHSRYNDLPERALAACGYKVLTRSATAGVDTFAKQDGSFFLFFQGHPEYDADTLLREYRRDIARFFGGERADYPAMPLGYFDPGAMSVVNGFRARALAARRSDLIADFPKNILEAGLKCPWRPAALGLYQRWAAYLSARKAQRRNASVPRRRTWRDWPIGQPAAGPT